jgi:hypothetical protein
VAIAYIGNSVNVSPERGSRAAKEADVCGYFGFDYIGCATGDLVYLLFGWRTTRRHLCLMVEEGIEIRDKERAPLITIALRLRISFHATVSPDVHDARLSNRSVGERAHLPPLPEDIYTQAGLGPAWRSAVHILLPIPSVRTTVVVCLYLQYTRFKLCLREVEFNKENGKASKVIPPRPLSSGPNG